MGLALGVAVSLGAAPCSWDWRPLSYEGRNPGRAWEPVAKSPHPLSGSKVQSSGPARGAATRLEHSRAFLLTGTDRMEVVTGAKAGSSPRPAPALLPLRLCHGTLKATKCENPYRTQCPFTIHPSSTHHPSTTQPASQPASHPSIHTPNKTRDIPTTSEGSLVPVWVCSVLWVTKDQGALFAAWVLGGVCVSRSLSPQGLQPGGRRHGRPSPFSRCPPTGPGGEWGALQQEGSEGAAVAALLWRLCFSSSHVNSRSLGQLDKRPLYPGCHLLCSGGGRENGLHSWGAWHQDTRLFFPSHRLRVSGSQDPAGASKAVGWHLQPASGAAAAQGGPFHCRARGGAQSWGRGRTVPLSPGDAGPLAGPRAVASVS